MLSPGFCVSVLRNRPRNRVVVCRTGYALNEVSESYKNKWKARALKAEQAVAEMSEAVEDLQDDVDNMQDLVARLKAENAALRNGAAVC